MTQVDARLSANAFFPGLGSENEGWLREAFAGVLNDWFAWRAEARPPSGSGPDPDTSDAGDHAALSGAIAQLLLTLRGETPTHSPRYLGHMVSELTIPALTGHFAALLHNPNNTSREVSRAGSIIESEAITMLGEMVGYDPSLVQGHFTSCGTIANLEGAWRARFRLDHWLALALHISEKTGEALNPFDVAHMGWARHDELRSLFCAGEEEAIREASAVAGNPADVYRRIGAAAGAPYEGPVMLVPGNRHFSWRKVANVLGIGEEAFWSIALDGDGRLDLVDLAGKVEEASMRGRPVIMIVSVAGTTETGQIDPVKSVSELLAEWNRERGWRIWHHVDAAYGGFFCTAARSGCGDELSPQAAASLHAISQADSLTIDPHKLGYSPYACGAFLTADPERYAVSSFSAPYLASPQTERGKWAYTLEGSRTATGAAAVWLTGKTLGYGEQFGRFLESTIRARRELAAALDASVAEARILEPADTNILCFSVAASGEPLSRSNLRTRHILRRLSSSDEFWISSTTLHAIDYGALINRHVQTYGGTVNEGHLVLARLVFMNPYWADSGVVKTLTAQFIKMIQDTMSEGTLS